MTGGSDYGAYYSYNLKNLDRYVEFNKVPVGSYRYIVKAVNSYGEEILVDQPYLIR